MATRCKECIFKDLDGGKYPCNGCSEIMDITGAKCIESHFKTIVKYNKNIRPKERLEDKLNEILTLTNKKMIYVEYKDLKDGNMMLTAFLNNGKDIEVYQIVDAGEELVENVVLLDEDLLHKINKITKRGV
ncbi:hypothetical protein [Clostridium kluyveri]|uniref:Uncharacterized protein n=1 Tax=Clostridium kluyveri TaxID=1534 RepID=A0A1L5FB40_CLOKL|nr:hypothetical protein [Clostridium kluyveri]APM40197.1 hypothetical protein BS101_16350 [Clostridium kluyveri]UZQ49548.1 hypothetical protein OP486_16570 [Clostridium kluyveri]